MRKLLRNAAVAAAMIVAIGTNAAAQTFTFAYSGSIVSWIVPASGSYYITAIGAQGGHGTLDQIGYVGGLGASMGGLFSFNAGDVLQLAVGGMGSSVADNYNGGGGGGSFVVDAFNNPLLVAGGGGGIRSYAEQNGCDALTGQYGGYGSGFNPTSSCGAKSTDLGLGGTVSSGSWGGGGAGFYGDGAIDFDGAGMSWANGLAGGAGSYFGLPFCTSAGGFGGGGSGTGCGGGGGGGGYSGGDGGWIAGGGGSFNLGANQVNDAGVGFGDGSISIVTATPEPATMSLMITGLGMLGGVAKRRKSRKDVSA